MLIVSDALRQDVLGCYGGVASTPNIDWLAQNGVLFENAYSTSPWTSPSSVAMLTGNYATSYAYSREGLTKPSAVASSDELVYIPRIYVPDAEVTLAEALAQSGYETGMVVENVNATLHNSLQGLDSIPESTPTPESAARIDSLCGGALCASIAESPAYGHAFQFLSYLDARPTGSPYFAVYWMLDPHSPYSPVERFRSRIRIDPAQLPVPMHFYWTRIPADRSKLSPIEQRFMFDLYVAEVESMDERVGFVLDVLRARGTLDDTYVVFTSDHGEQFGEHGLYEHGGHGLGCHYYEGLVRVPFVVFGPGVPKGKRVGEVVSTLGLMPTLEALVGARYDADMQGENYRPLMTGTGVAREAVYLDDVQTHDQVDALVEGSYKLITREDGRHELYEVGIDPQESIDLAARNPELVSSMYNEVTTARAENERRQRRNSALLRDDIPRLSDRERAQIVKKLRALGYVK